MKFIAFSSATLVLLLGVGLFSPRGARAEQSPIKIYAADDDLAHNHINRILRDSRGFLWFCTDEGLSRFDGYRFNGRTNHMV
jgi:ligand-binding sensor domain-containing protein